MSHVSIRFIDIYALRPGRDGLEILLLRRSAGVRCPGSWETVHGHIEAGETPVQAAIRELEEETGLPVERLYNLSRVESFYLHRTDEVMLIPAFAAFVPAEAAVHLSHEHDAWVWLPAAEAQQRFAWPRERRAVADATLLLAAGHAGPLEDVLRVPTR